MSKTVYSELKKLLDYVEPEEKRDYEECKFSHDLRSSGKPKRILHIYQTVRYLKRRLFQIKKIK